MRRLYCGTEGPSVLVCNVGPDDTVTLTQQLTVTDNPLKLKHGAPGGVGIEWVVAHPSGSHVYALVSFWNHALGELHPLQVSPADGLLTRPVAGPLSTDGYQPCHAAVADGRWLAVSHYLSGNLTLFDISNAATPVRTALVPLPAPNAWVPGTPLDAGALGVQVPPAPLAHGVAFHPSGAWLAVADAGLGRLVCFPHHNGRLGDHTEIKVDGAGTCSGHTQALIASKLGARPRHVAFAAGGGLLLHVQETTNAVLFHAFDPSTGTIQPAHIQLSAQAVPPDRGLLPSRAFSGMFKCLGIRPTFLLVGPVALLTVGFSMAAELTCITRSGTVIVTNRHFGRGGKSSMHTLSTQDSKVWSPSQLIETGSNPRHFALDAAERKLFLGVMGGFEVFDVSESGELQLSKATRLEGELAKINIDCTAIVDA